MGELTTRINNHMHVCLVPSMFVPGHAYSISGFAPVSHSDNSEASLNLHYKNHPELV